MVRVQKELGPVSSLEERARDLVLSVEMVSKETFLDTLSCDY